MAMIAMQYVSLNSHSLPCKYFELNDCNKLSNHRQNQTLNHRVSASLAAAIMNGKYANAVPLYRLEQEFIR